MTLVTLFGRPGAGKTTVGNALAERYGFVHLPLGAMLKVPAILAEIGIETDEMARAVASGRTVTNANLYPWLSTRIASIDGPVVVDGFPRAANSAQPFAELVSGLPINRQVTAICLESSSTVTQPRIRARGRADDDERLRDRNDEFERVQIPLLVTLPARVRVVSVDATQSRGDVIAAVERALGLAGKMPEDR